MIKRACIAIAALFLLAAPLLHPAPATAAGSWSSVPLATKPPADALPADIPPDGLGTRGEGFQYVFSLVYAPSDPSRAYFSVDSTGVWRSDDEGHNWYPIFNGYSAQGGVSLAVDPQDPDIVLAAGMLGYERKRAEPHKQREQGIFRTTDGGLNWQKVYNTGFYRRLGKANLFAFIPPLPGQSTSVVFAAGSDEGLLRSNDRGVTWNKVKLDKNIGEIHDMELRPAAPGSEPVLLLITEKGLFRVSGEHAEQIGKGLPTVNGMTIEELEKKGLFTLALTPADPNLVLVAAGENGIWRSTNGGESFTSASFNGVDWWKNHISKSVISDVSLSPVDANVAYARAQLTGLGPMYSNDGGKSWQRAVNTNTNKLILDEGFYFSSPFAPHPNNANMALHVSNGRARILRTDDGGKNWRYSGRGFTGAALERIAFTSKTEAHLAFVDHGLWRTDDNFKSFTEVKSLDRMFGAKSCGSISAKGNIILLSVGQWTKRGIALSKDRGKTWSYNEKFDTLRGRTSIIHPRDDKRMAIGTAITYDGGKNWQALGNAVTGELSLYATVTDKTSGEPCLFAVHEIGKNKSQLYESKDFGKTWKALGTQLPFSLPAIRGMDATPDCIYAAVAGGLYVLNLKNQNPAWITLGSVPKDALGRRNLNAVAVSPTNPNDIWIGYTSPGYGRSIGVFRSLDGGNTWKRQGVPDVPLLTIISITPNPFEESVFVGTYFGMYKFDPQK